jgi:hypothetical protein
MTHPAPIDATLDEWIARESIPFSVDSPETLNATAKRRGSPLVGLSASTEQ